MIDVQGSAGLATPPFHAFHPASLELYDRTNALSLVHQVEG